jgi:hypothetical protein
MSSKKKLKPLKPKTSLTEEEWLNELQFISNEVAHVVDIFNFLEEIVRLGKESEAAFDVFNSEPMFWRVQTDCLQESLFMGLGRLCDSAPDAINVNRVLNTAMEHPEFFAKEAVRRRMKAQKISEGFLNQLLSRAWIPKEKVDFKYLKKAASFHMTRIETIYRPIRDSHYGHRLTHADIQAMFEKTNRKELANTLDGLHELVTGLNELYERGIKPEIGVRNLELAELPDDGVIAKSVPQDEALAKMKSGVYNAGNVLFLVDGKTIQKDANGQDVIDPKTGERKFESTVSIVNNVPVALSKDDAARYAAARVPGFTNGVAPADGTKVPLVTKRAWDNQVHNVEIARGIAKDVGSDDEFQKALDAPGAAAALKDFARFAGLHDPYAAMKQMEGMKNKDGNPVYSPRELGLLSDMFGAGKAKDYHDQIEAETAGKKTGEETSARQKAELANPTTAAQAQASLASADATARNNPTPENLAVLRNAQNKYRTFSALENQQKYSQAREAEKARYDEMDLQNQKDLPALMAGIKNYQVDPEKLESLRGGARKQFMAAVLAQDRHGTPVHIKHATRRNRILLRVEKRVSRLYHSILSLGMLMMQCKPWMKLTTFIPAL